MLRLLSALLLGVIATHANHASAHPPFATVIQVVIDAQGSVQCTIVHDGLALALNQQSSSVTELQIRALLDAKDDRLSRAIAQARDDLEKSFVILADGTPLTTKIVASSSEFDIRAWQSEQATNPGPCMMAAIVQASCPSRAAKLVIRPPAVLGAVLLAIDRDGEQRLVIPLAAGESSPEFAWSQRASADADNEPTVNILEIAWRYLVIGFHHIIPDGTDHELFVLGLFLLTPRLRPLLWQVTAFTVAHTVTLTLATLGLITASPAIIEPIIAFSIAFIAIENLFATKLHAWRLVVVFLFGCVHGFGFAAGLISVGLPTQQLITGLVSFSFGVECGQIAVLIAAFALLGWWRAKPWYRSAIAVPASCAIALIAVYWGIGRI